MTLPNWPSPERPEVPPQPPPPRGWYQDPQVQGQERWWSGFDWTEATHKASNSHPASSLGAYTRSRWPGLNRAAKYAELAAGAGVVVFFVWCVIAALDASASAATSPTQVAFAIFTLALVVATIGLGGLGLARSTYFGGAALAGWSLGIGIVLAVAFAGMALAFAQV